jgi:putative esterase
MFSEKALHDGVLRQDGLTMLWAFEAPKTRNVSIVDDLDGASLAPRTTSMAQVFPANDIPGHPKEIFKLHRLPDSDIFVDVEGLPTGAAMAWRFALDAKPLGNPHNLEVFPVNPENQPHLGVPKGTLMKPPAWHSHVFDGTTRDWWVYIPAEYRPETPACVMVFQDGAGAKNYAPTTMDNLIAKGDMPVTVGVFISPGTTADGKSNRSFEYDTLSDQYSRLVLEEILPEVEKTVHLRHDPESRAIAGASSGGICAFTVAWQRPDQFSNVLSWVGSFVNLQGGPTKIGGGHNYPPMIRETPRKPIRVFQQDGINDLDNPYGNWPLANQEVSKALTFAGYDHILYLGQGFHSDVYGRYLLPTALRWLWRK